MATRNENNTENLALAFLPSPPHYSSCPPPVLEGQVPVFRTKKTPAHYLHTLLSCERLSSFSTFSPPLQQLRELPPNPRHTTALDVKKLQTPLLAKSRGPCLVRRVSRSLQGGRHYATFQHVLETDHTCPHVHTVAPKREFVTARMLSVANTLNDFDVSGLCKNGTSLSSPFNMLASLRYPHLRNANW